MTVRVDEQHNFLEGLKFIIGNIWMSTDASREVLLELFPPDVLVHPACLKLPLLFRIMREVLEFVGIAVESRQGLYVPQAVSSALYGSDNVMKSTADRYISEYKHDADSAARGQSSSTQTQDTFQRGDSTDIESGWRRVDAANCRFDDKEKYGGMLAESPNLAEARNAYLTYCNQMGFPRADRVRLVSCILKGPALWYWTSRIDGKLAFSELGAVFRELESQFDTPAHQRQIESLTLSMTIESTREKHKCSRIAALGVLYHEVARLNEQFPRVKRGPVFRTQTLMKIVDKYEWSRTSEEEVMQDKIDYDELYTKLSGSLVIWESEVKRSGRDPDAVDDRRSASKSSPAFIGYGAQYANPVTSKRSQNKPSPRPRYSRGPSAQRSATRNPSPNTAPPRTRSSRFPGRQDNFGRYNDISRYRFRSDNQIDTRCWKCRRLGHWRAQCTFSDANSMVNAARARIKEIGGDPNKAAAQVLYELVSEEDECYDTNDYNDNHFEELLVSETNSEGRDLDLVAAEHSDTEHEQGDLDFQQAGGENE